MSKDKELVALINQHLSQLPLPMKEAVEHSMRNSLLNDIRSISKRLDLDTSKVDTFFFEGLTVLVGLVDLDELKDNLIVELGISYEEAVRLQHAFDDEILHPILQDARHRGLTEAMLIPEQTSQRSQAIEDVPRWEICEITFETIRKTGWFTAGEIRWVARATGPTGVYAAGHSEKFWVPNVSSDGGVQMPDASLARKLAIPALETLTSRLLSDGWEYSGCSEEDWWERQFRRRVT